MALTCCRNGGRDVGQRVLVWLGQRYKREILLAWPLNRYPQFVGRSETFIITHGAASVFLARFAAVVRAFVPLVAGILGMSPRQFYAANILSALAWGPAHVFPGVLLAMALRVAGVSAGQLAMLVIAMVIAFSIAVWAVRSYLKGHPLEAKLPTIPIRLRADSPLHRPLA
jgi:membrane protein DedA with SNARE-associated domain